MGIDSHAIWHVDPCPALARVQKTAENQFSVIYKLMYLPVMLRTRCVPHHGWTLTFGVKHSFPPLEGKYKYERYHTSALLVASASYVTISEPPHDFLCSFSERTESLLSRSHFTIVRDDG